MQVKCQAEIAGELWATSQSQVCSVLCAQHAVFSVQCEVCSPQHVVCAVFSVYCAQHAVCAVFSVQCKVCRPQRAVCSVQCAVCAVCSSYWYVLGHYKIFKNTQTLFIKKMPNSI